MDALLKALEARGYSVEISKEDPATYVVVGKEKLKVRLSEKIDREEKELTKEEKNKLPWATDRWTYTPTGKLKFVIDEFWATGIRKRWIDKTRKALED